MKLTSRFFICTFLSVSCSFIWVSNSAYADVMSYQTSITMGMPTGILSTYFSNSAYTSSTVQLLPNPYAENVDWENSTGDPTIDASASISDVGMHAASSVYTDENGIYGTATGGVSVAGGRALGYGEISRQFTYEVLESGAGDISVPYSISWMTQGSAGYAYSRYDLWLIFYDYQTEAYREARLSNDYAIGIGSMTGTLLLDEVNFIAGHTVLITEWLGNVGGDTGLPPEYNPPTGVPEPATILLLGLGLAGLAGARRKQK